MTTPPAWLTQGEAILGPLLRDTSESLKAFIGEDPHIAALPSLALHHFAHCLTTSIDTNRAGRHAPALALLRQAIESLTIIELGLHEPTFSMPLLDRWSEDKLSHGELRQRLETTAWPKYGYGLWKESWSTYFSLLAKAVQPYAHCSHELLQWSLAALTPLKQRSFVIAVGGYDATKASRLTLFHVLTGWTLARILQATRPPLAPLVPESSVRELGRALAHSEYLLEGQDWSVQLWPHMFMRF